MVLLSESARRSIKTIGASRIAYKPQPITQPTTQDVTQPATQTIREFTPQEIQKLKDLGLGRLSGKIERQLSEMGYNDAEIQYLTGRYAPQLKVYGAKSAGAIQQAGAYEYETDEGKRYVGTESFIREKIKVDAEAHPFSGTIQTIQGQRLGGEQTSVEETPTVELNKSQKFFKKVEERYLDPTLTYIASGAEKIISLGGLLNREKVFSFGELVGKKSGTGVKGTMEYTIEAVTPEQKYRRGDITEEEYIRQATKAEYAGSFFKGTIIGGISVLAPPVGLALATGAALPIILRPGETKKQFIVAPKETFGNILFGVAGAGVGGVGTSMIATKIKGYTSTIGREYVPIERIATKEVISGQKKFPEAPFGTSKSAQLRLKIFERNRYNLPDETKSGVYHATPYTFGKETKTVAGTSEVPGLYVAPSLSTYFLKLGNDFRVFGLSQESIISKSPSALRIYPKGFGLYKGKTSAPGRAYVLNIKPEIEAVIPPETPLVQTGSRFYTVIDGTRVPINQYTVGDIGESLASVSTKAGGYAPVPIVTPSSSLSSVGVSGSLYLSPSTIPSSSIPKSSSSSKSSDIYYSSRLTSPSKINLPSYKSYASSIKSTSYIASSIKAPSSFIPSTIRVPTPSYVPTPSIKNPPYIPKKLTSPNVQRKQERFTALVKGYKAYYYLKGKKQYLPGVLGRGEAIKKGESQVLKSISARFGIESAKSLVPATRELQYTPRKDIFRGYKIRGKQKILLKDEWIQKAGTTREPTIRGARLGRGSEISQLLSFRKRTSRRLF